jgi:hypothetical protein
MPSLSYPFRPNRRLPCSIDPRGSVEDGADGGSVESVTSMRWRYGGWRPPVALWRMGASGRPVGATVGRGHHRVIDRGTSGAPTIGWSEARQQNGSRQV